MKKIHCCFRIFLCTAVLCFFSLTAVFITFSTAETLASTKSSALQHREVPAEILQLFSEGIPAQEFAGMSDYLPRALEGLVDGDALVIIELHDVPVAAKKMAGRKRGLDMTSEAMTSYQHDLEQTQDLLSRELRAMDVDIFSNYTTVYNGFLARIPYQRLQDVRNMSGVKAIHPAPVHQPMLQASVPLMGATDVWEGVHGVDGEGVVIAIIDTGIDYTHTALGGSGDPGDYSGIDPAHDALGFFPNEKVIGGYDFAGTLYHAGCTQEQESAGTCSRTPNPDNNPLDENGHGTHVAAIAAGLDKDASDPGVAPGAELMALKVFGRSGSTNLTVDALEWAANHYMQHGYPHVINMSLGSNFGTGNDPSVAAANNAADLGMVVVASAGNAGDIHYITGTPGSGSKVISVAASTTGYITGPTVRTAGLDPIIYMPGSFDDNTGRFDSQVIAPLGYAGNLPGAVDNQLCTTSGISAGALNGKVALIRRGNCTFSSKINNAHALGAVAALIYNNVDGIMSMEGEPVNIPAGSIAGQDGLLLTGKDGQGVTVSAQNQMTTIPDPYTEADHIGSFSSRGPRGTDSFLKPEVTAPGVNISAAAMGTGTGKVCMSGTSMAAPHVAGLAALILEGKPAWTSDEIKALMMNTAVDLTDAAPIPCSGSGRVDAVRAMDSDTVVIGDAGLTSLNWGVVMSRSDEIRLERQMVIYNKGLAEKTYNLAAHIHPGSLSSGQTLNVTPAQITVPAGSNRTVTVTLTLDMTETTSAFNNLEEYFGWITLTPAGGGQILRLPYYFQPKPFASLRLSTIQGITDPDVDQAEVRITHNGAIASDLWLFPALNHNPSPDPSMSGQGDVRLFGLDHQGWTHGTHGDMLEISINTWDYWHVPQPFFAEFDLYIDADQDGTFDYVLFNYNLGWWQGTGHNNFWIVTRVDLATGMLYLGSPFLIYSDYNAAYMEWFVPVQWLDLDEDESSFDYQLFSFDTGSQEMPRGNFDYKKFPLNWTIDNGNPGPGNAETTAKIWVNDQAGYSYSRPLGAMLVDYMGDPRNSQGAQAYFVSLEPGKAISPGILMLLLDDE